MGAGNQSHEKLASMTQRMTIADWRSEIDLIDAEFIYLLNRRVQLAVEMLMLLRNQSLSLGNAVSDADRLSVLLSRNPTPV